MLFFFQGSRAYLGTYLLSFSPCFTVTVSLSIFLLTKRGLKSANPVLSKLELCVQAEYRV